MPRRLIPQIEMRSLFGCERTKLYQLIKEDIAPRPVSRGRWDSDEAEEAAARYIESLKAAQRGGHSPQRLQQHEAKKMAGVKRYWGRVRAGKAKHPRTIAAQRKTEEAKVGSAAG